MNEYHLHQIWKNKTIPFHKLKLTCLNNFRLIHQGNYNQLESGPDFFDGIIDYQGVIWRGNIEVHFKSSDWYKHKHQLDNTYNNVILHVVYEHDQDVFVNGRRLPTIQLKDFINFQNLFHGKLLKSINCKDLIFSIDPIYLESMKEKSIINRLNRKVKMYNRFDEFEISQVMYYFIMSAFGFKVNQIPFQLLAANVPIKILKKCREEDLCHILIGASGLDKQNNPIWIFFKRKYDLAEIEVHLWKKKGLNPKGFPEYRIKQLAILIQNWDFNTNFINLDTFEIVNYLNSLFESKVERISFSKNLINNIIINGFLPFMWWFSIYQNNFQLKERVLEIFDLIDSENNHIIRKWKEINIKSKKAFDSQALLEIYNEFCMKNQCLNCDVGIKILTK